MTAIILYNVPKMRFEDSKVIFGEHNSQGPIVPFHDAPIVTHTRLFRLCFGTRCSSPGNRTLFVLSAVRRGLSAAKTPGFGSRATAILSPCIRKVKWA